MCSFFWPWENQYKVHDFHSISNAQFSATSCSVSAERSLNRVPYSIQVFLLLTLSKSFLFDFMCIWCLYTTHSDFNHLLRVWYQKLEFCVSSFYSYYYLLWWSMHWHSMLALFLLYVFLIWIFSRSYLIQATGFDASRAFYIICSQLITFEQATLFSAYCTCFIALLVSPYVFCFALALICFWLNLIVQFTSEFSLSCAELCKVSPDDSDHVIL